MKRSNFCAMPLKTLRLFALMTGLASSTVPCQASSLQQMYELALQNDAKLKTAEAEYEAQIEVEKQARSRLLPQVTADRNFGSTESGKTAPEIISTNNGPRAVLQRVNQRVHERRWEVSATQPVVDVSAWYGFKSGKSTTHQAEATLEYEQLQMMIRVAEAYFGVLKQLEILNTSRAEEAANEKQWRQAQAQFAKGVVAKTDSEQAHAEYAISAAKRVSDEGELEAAYEAMATITGSRERSLSLLSAAYPVTNPEPANVQDWLNLALKNNQELQSARYAANAAHDSAIANRMSHLPTVGVQLGYSDSDVHGSQQLDPYSPYTLPPASEGWTKSGAININVPIYSGGYTSSKAREAYALYGAALEKRNDLQKTITEQTRVLHTAVKTAVVLTQAHEQAMSSAQIALESTSASYKSGIKSIVDVLQSQRIFYEAMRDHTQARFNYIIYLLKLKQVCGVLSAADIAALNQWLVAPRMDQDQP
jgi:outer membrane protein